MVRTNFWHGPSRNRYILLNLGVFIDFYDTKVFTVALL